MKINQLEVGTLDYLIKYTQKQLKVGSVACDGLDLLY